MRPAVLRSYTLCIPPIWISAIGVRFVFPGLQNRKKYASGGFMNYRQVYDRTGQANPEEPDVRRKKDSIGF
jgi:hypothetical protein